MFADSLIAVEARQELSAAFRSCQAQKSRFKLLIAFNCAFMKFSQFQFSTAPNPDEASNSVLCYLNN
jgi:hypothetical protein